MATKFDPCTDPSTWPLIMEANGSPKESYGKDGFSAVRTIMTPYARRQEAIADLWGTGLGVGSTFGEQYPGNPGVYVDGLVSEPMTKDDAQLFQDIDASNVLAEYPNSLAKLTVTYKYLTADPFEDEPVPEGYVDYDFSYNKEGLLLPSRELRYASETTQIPREADTVFMYYESVIEHRWTWHNVTNPPFTAIRQLAGHINKAEFKGGAIGTMLFEGATGGIRSYFNPDPDDPTPAWSIGLVFKEKRIVDKDGAFEGGWNYVYRSEPEGERGWQEIELSDGSKPYPESDLTPLFKPEPAAA